MNFMKKSTPLQASPHERGGSMKIQSYAKVSLDRGKLASP